MGGGVQQSYTDTNLELVTKAVNPIGKSIDCDITEMENTVHEIAKSFANQAIMARAEDVASLVLPTLTCNRSVSSPQIPVRTIPIGS